MRTNIKLSLSFLSLLFLCLLSEPLSAASGRSASDFRLDSGLRVILQNEPGNQLAVMQVCFPGSSLRQNADNAGIENMLLDVMQKGGEKYPRREADAVLEKYAASVSASVTKDYSVYEMHVAVPFFESVLEVFSDGLLHPLLPAEEIELTRSRMLAAVRAGQDDPDEVVADALNGIFYHGHPYENDIEGTLESLPRITRDMLLEHHRRMLDDAGAFIVVVGDFKKAALGRMLEKHLAEFRPQTLVSSAITDFRIQPEHLARVEREQPAWTMILKFAAPEAPQPQYAALKIGLDYFSHRLWEEVRSKRALAYSVYCGMGMNLSNFGFCYMATRHTEEAMQVFYAEVEKLRTEPMNAEDLQQTRAVFTTRYYQGMESASAQASRLTAAQIYFGDYNRFDDFMRAVQALTPEDIRKAAEEYLNNFTYGISGPAGGATDEVFRRSASEAFGSASEQQN